MEFELHSHCQTPLNIGMPTTTACAMPGTTVLRCDAPLTGDILALLPQQLPDLCQPTEMPTACRRAHPAPKRSLRCCTLPRQRSCPAARMPMRLHSTSHSSMLCDVMITVCPARPRHSQRACMPGVFHCKLDSPARTDPPTAMYHQVCTLAANIETSAWQTAEPCWLPVPTQQCCSR